MGEKTAKTTLARRGIENPYKFNDELARAIVDLARAGTPKTTIADKLRIDRTTIYRWLAEGEADPEGQFGEFFRDFRQAQAFHQEALADVVRDAALSDPKWAAWSLEKLYPQVYGKTAQVEVHNHAAPAHSNVIDVTDKSTAALEAELEEIDE